MTAKEYLRGKIADFLLPTNAIDVQLAEQSLSATTEVSADNSETWVKLRKAYAQCLCYVLRLPASVTQGTFNKSDVNRDWYENELKNLAKELDDPTLLESVKKPNITQAGEWL